MGSAPPDRAEAPSGPRLSETLHWVTHLRVLAILGVVSIHNAACMT